MRLKPHADPAAEHDQPGVEQVDDVGDAQAQVARGLVERLQRGQVPGVGQGQQRRDALLLVVRQALVGPVLLLHAAGRRRRDLHMVQ
jgi:hypothetical protein